MSSQFTFRNGQAQEITYHGTMLVDVESSYQHIQALETVSGEKVLVLDGCVMVDTADEHKYHELLVHPGCLARPDAKSALVLGGGDGFSVKYLLKHGFKKIVMVDIDEKVTEVSIDVFGKPIAEALGRPVVEVCPMDAVDYFRMLSEEAQQRGRGSPVEKFDFIGMDLTDPDGNDVDSFVDVLYSNSFLETVVWHLTDAGVLTVQVSSAENHALHQREVVSRLKQHFAYVYMMGQYVESYKETQFFCYASHAPLLFNDQAAVDKMSKLAEKRKLGIRSLGPQDYVRKAKRC